MGVKKVIVFGKISDHQWGTVVSGGGCAPTESAESQFRLSPLRVVKKWKRKS